MPTNVQSALKARMDYLVARQSVISQNIANADTPGYITKDLTDPAASGPNSGTFAMMVTNASHLSSGGSQGSGGFRTVSDATYLQHNGNSVRIDQEMVKMNETQLNYRMMTDLYAKQRQLSSIALRGQ